MIEEIKKLNDQYFKWLKEKTLFRQVEDYVEITTPFLDRHNDHLQIYIQPKNNSYELTDGGYTIEDLEMSGCTLESPKRQQLLKMTLAGFGVENFNNVLTVKATENNFGIKKHNLIQAMLAINDLFHLAKPNISSLFFEDVVAWLELHEIRYTSNVTFIGKANYDHRFDFVIPKSKIAPERILKVISNPTKDTAESAIFAWLDTKDIRPSDSQAYTILNDLDHKMGEKVIGALESYEINPVLWSKREDALQRLSS